MHRFALPGLWEKVMGYSWRRSWLLQVLHRCEKERQDLEEIIKVSISSKNDKSCICEMFNVIEETWRVGMN
jgi:hypothetical protein